MASKKNVLLIIADDLGRDLSIYGFQPAPNTPNLERLAAQGTVFENAFASTASCSGSRSTLYTGLHTHQNGQYGLAFREPYFTTFDSIETHPWIFNRLGYSTQIIGKVHVGPAKTYPWAVRNDKHGRDGKWISQRLNEHIKRCQNEDVPFFTTIGFVDPHRDGTRGGWANNNDFPGIEKNVYDPKDVRIPGFLNDLPGVRQELAEYYQAIDRMDQSLGMALAVLEKRNVVDSTLVVFLSDNGAPFVSSKATLYDAGIHLPFVVRCPGKQPGKRNPNMVSYVDLLPTFLDWTNNTKVKCTNPGGAKRIGTSFLPIVDSEDRHPDYGQVFCSHTFHELTAYWPTRVLRTHKYKYHRNIVWQLPFPIEGGLYASLSFEDMRNHQPDGPKSVKLGKRPIRDYSHRPAELLFDIENDPNELTNLADQPEYKEILHDMRVKLEEWQRATADPWYVRDGVSIRHVSKHIPNGLRIPDRFDFDVDNPGSNNVPIIKRKGNVEVPVADDDSS